MTMMRTSIQILITCPKMNLTQSPLRHPRSHQLNRISIPLLQTEPDPLCHRYQRWNPHPINSRCCRKSPTNLQTLSYTENTVVLDLPSHSEEHILGPSAQPFVTKLVEPLPLLEREDEGHRLPDQEAANLRVPEASAVEIEAYRLPDQGAAAADIHPPEVPEEDYSFLHNFTYDQHQKQKE